MSYSPPHWSDLAPLYGCQHPDVNTQTQSCLILSHIGLTSHHCTDVSIQMSVHTNTVMSYSLPHWSDLAPLYGCQHPDVCTHKHSHVLFSPTLVWPRTTVRMSASRCLHTNTVMSYSLPHWSDLAPLYGCQHPDVYTQTQSCLTLSHIGLTSHNCTDVSIQMSTHKHSHVLFSPTLVWPRTTVRMSASRCLYTQTQSCLILSHIGLTSHHCTDVSIQMSTHKHSHVLLSPTLVWPPTTVRMSASRCLHTNTVMSYSPPHWSDLVPLYVCQHPDVCTHKHSHIQTQSCLEDHHRLSMSDNKHNCFHLASVPPTPQQNSINTNIIVSINLNQFTPPQTWSQIHWNVFKYKYSWGIQFFFLNTNVFKYKCIGKYFKILFQTIFIFRMYCYVGKRKVTHMLRHLVYWHNLCFAHIDWTMSQAVQC